MKLAILFALSVAAPALAQTEAERWAAQAARVTIGRDNFGIAHVHGRSDADAVFGMIYAQAEDDFNRIETNFINAQGRLAEAEGEVAIWRDLRMKMFIDPAELQAEYARSPAWLRALMTAWADALNFYLARHPGVRPRVITRFEPWMALSFSEGSIGGDIESISLAGLEAFYTRQPVRLPTAETSRVPPEPTGSNGFAIAPSHSRSGHALLLINPHTSFFFRSEARVESDAGLNVYGAATWGQFFTYQGFNDRAGWMHTSSGVDVIDEFLLTTRTEKDRLEYRFGADWLPVATKTIAIPWRDAAGTLNRRDFTIWRTRHGPVVRSENGRWISVALMHKPLAALQQSFLRTKANDLASFLEVAQLQANSSNNTIFASAKGEIAYLHPQFVPRRNDRFDYTRPVDGSDPAAAWAGEHTPAERPQVINPANGWVMNVNNHPWTAAGADSPVKARFARYMDQAGWNPREPHALKVLAATPKLTLETLLDAAYDPWLPAFTTLIPPLVTAYDRLPATDPRRARLATAIAELRNWDCRTGEASVATTVAIHWAEALVATLVDVPAGDRDTIIDKLADAPNDDQRLAALDQAITRLTNDFGRWDTPWGEVNRLQRLTGDLVQPHDDARPSLPIGFASAQWGALASFGTAADSTTKKSYGSYGNSFVAVVEFAPQVAARAISVGGQSGNPASPHFSDQGTRYRTRDFRPVRFTTADSTGEITRRYQPGD